MPLRIVHYNDPVLRRKGEKITSFDSALAAFSSSMIEAMHAARGIGLAAQQVGRAAQICVVDLSATEAEFDWKLDGKKLPLELFMPMVVANPKITTVRGVPKEAVEEGCLSFPEIRGDVTRPTVITVKFQDEHGVPHVLECDGLLARCLQHEADHLNGVLFIDRMDRKTRAGIDDAVRALARQTTDSETPAIS